MAVSLAVVKRVAARLEAMLVVDEASVAARRLAAFRDAGVPLPRPSPTHVDTPVGTRYLIDAEMQKALSTFVRRSCLSFEETVRLWRGQHAADARPNKALRGHHLAWLPTATTSKLSYSRSLPTASVITSVKVQPYHVSYRETTSRRTRSRTRSVGVFAKAKTQGPIWSWILMWPSAGAYCLTARSDASQRRTRTQLSRQESSTTCHFQSAHR